MTSKDAFAGSTAEALLEAHVAWLAGRLESEALEDDVARRLDAALALAGQLKLEDVVTLRSIQQTAIGYASDMTLGGAIPALVGDIATALRQAGSGFRGCGRQLPHGLKVDRSAGGQQSGGRR